MSLSDNANTDPRSVEKDEMKVTAICIRSAGSDLVAYSALDTLVRKMSFQDSLVSLWREDVWLLGFATGAQDATETTEMLVERTGVFVNPNRHRHEVIRSEEKLPHGTQRGRGELGIVVWSYEDPEIRPVMVAVRERLGVESLRKARRLTLWWPGFSENLTDPDDRRDVASSMVATLSRAKGLLANPHFQGSFLLEKTCSPAELLGSVTEAEGKVAVK
ncbi:MAG: hypothetical protein AMJ46_05995 [Latescibacteria bacterium DG_63]|nr:MAG: hypothetical protein AMJ46_05995 [Latescibacteria bacterium DG_63]